MKSRLMTLAIPVAALLFSVSALFATPIPIEKLITFDYIHDSDGGYPTTGTYDYEFWTETDFGGMIGTSPSGTTIESEILTMAGGVVVTFDIGADPVYWSPYSMIPTETVKLKVTNPSNGESNTFTGYPITQTEDPQTFSDEYTLPVELLSFTVRTEDQAVLLEWETASEVDNAGFNILKSRDYSADYEQANSTLIPGMGNTSESHEYSFTDVNVELGNTYYYKLESVDVEGKTSLMGPVAIPVGQSELDLPDDYALSQNYPNPFNPVTTIQYNLPEVSSVKLRIYNIQGRLVNELVNETQDAGIYTVQWEGIRSTGESYPSGVYFYELKTEYYRDIKKMFLVK
ncbi:T9SS type A sorting domain-containing protein [candidate division KSB1 bacterium]|nr:T9SS type A sorting domain-containing protein [candidate division KSB1 bacterium]